MKCACKGDFLDRFIQPSILLLLNSESMHGFSIYKRLQDSDIMDYSGIDPTGLYRTLKKMEDAGLLTSQWDTDTASQARRIYTITGDGRHCLINWSDTLISYKNSLENLANAIIDSLKETTE